MRFYFFCINHFSDAYVCAVYVLTSTVKAWGKKYQKGNFVFYYKYSFASLFYRSRRRMRDGETETATFCRWTVLLSRLRCRYTLRITKDKWRPTRRRRYGDACCVPILDENKRRVRVLSNDASRLLDSHLRVEGNKMAGCAHTEGFETWYLR